jgi:tRNA-splicing ligase RtcB
MKNYKVLRDDENSVPIFAWTNGLESSSNSQYGIEDEAMKQLANLSKLPFIHPHIALMPDNHAGKGSTVGSVIVTKKAIIPAAVGVDIGCGVFANKTNLTAKDLPDNLFKIRSAIEASIPHGRSDDGGINDKGAWYDGQSLISKIKSIDLQLKISNLIAEVDKLGVKHQALKRSTNRAINQLASLGTGNHFLELCIDENDNVWIMLHSGSRGVGNKIGSYFIELAKRDMEKYYIHLPDSDLAYLPEGTQNHDDYIHAMWIAQGYAKLNRELMMHLVENELRNFFPNIAYSVGAVNCHHNYVSKEYHYRENVYVTRKGAVSANVGEYGVILGSMGTKSYIVQGKGNRESFHSCSHGAGRKMSRTKAREQFTVEDHIKSTMGVECRKDIDVIDETPLAYKDIDLVMAAQEDLVDIVHTLKQVVCVKG